MFNFKRAGMCNSACGDFTLALPSKAPGPLETGGHVQNPHWNLRVGFTVKGPLATLNRRACAESHAATYAASSSTSSNSSTSRGINRKKGIIKNICGARLLNQ